MKRKLPDILIEAKIASKMVEIVEDVIIVFKEPTKSEHGCGIRMTNDPEIVILEISKGTKRNHDFKHNGRFYDWRYGNLPIDCVDDFIIAVRKLLDMEIEV